jgi:HlyD family secretion protein
MSERLPPIPTPSSQLWRQLRLQYLPVVIFLAGLAAAALLWTQWVAPPTLVGEVEAVRTELRAGQAGMLADLRIDMLQSVTAGQTLGHIVVTNAKLLDASLAVIRAEIEVLRTTTDMNFERLRLDWMSKRVELVSLQSELHMAEATLARVIALHRIKLVTDEQYDQAKNTRDAVEARLKAHAELIRRLEPGLQTLESANNRSMPAAAAEGLRASIDQRKPS